MRLRSILVILSLIAFLSVSIGGYFYFSTVKNSAFEIADKQAEIYAETIKNRISAFLEENIKSARILAGHKELSRVLTVQSQNTLTETNFILDHICESLGANVCYLMDIDGTVIASSNRNTLSNFVGNNYFFRPYFQKAIERNPSIYMALGITSGKRGVYFSYPVFDLDYKSPIGVAVIKASFNDIEKEITESSEGIMMLTDPHGIVFLSNRENMILKSLWTLSSDENNELQNSKQFGNGPWDWTGIQIDYEAKEAFDQSGNKYLTHHLKLDNYQGWELIYLHFDEVIINKVFNPIVNKIGYVILLMIFSIGLLVSILYRTASNEILRRKQAEKALLDSEETGQALLNSPTDSALLLDTNGVFLSLNEPASNALGRNIDDLIGNNIFSYLPFDFAERRRNRMDEVIQSKKAVRYQDKHRNKYLDTNLYPVFNDKGEVIRVAIYSRDVTNQKHAEEKLKLAKDKLDLYSKDLEVQVEKRTKEITGILDNTPAVVYIKDLSLNYIMANPMYEHLFGKKNIEILGKTDFDLFPHEIASQNRLNDLKVIKDGKSIQVEETILHDDGIHTYVSVKFPLYDEHNNIYRLCGIATDITAQKEAQNQLRRLSAKIIEGQEKERTAIARELHDELSQILTAIRYDAVWMENHLNETNPQMLERAQSMTGVIDKAIEDVRGLAIRLRPSALDELGLIDAIDWYVNEFEKRTGILCIFKRKRKLNLSKALSTATYRIVQESLTNISRHSLANHVNISIKVENNVMKLSIIDDGEGFTMSELSQSSGLGIAGMHERAELVGGSLDIHSVHEQGTEISFIVPLNENERLEK
jgi:PAS domain S-box-containing protein